MTLKSPRSSTRRPAAISCLGERPDERDLGVARSGVPVQRQTTTVAPPRHRVRHDAVSCRPPPRSSRAQSRARPGRPVGSPRHPGGQQREARLAARGPRTAAAGGAVPRPESRVRPQRRRLPGVTSTSPPRRRRTSRTVSATRTDRLESSTFQDVTRTGTDPAAAPAGRRDEPGPEVRAERQQRPARARRPAPGPAARARTAPGTAAAGTATARTPAPAPAVRDRCGASTWTADSSTSRTGYATGVQRRTRLTRRWRTAAGRRVTPVGRRWRSRPRRPQTQPSQPRSTGGAEGAGFRPAACTRSVRPSTSRPATHNGSARNRIVVSPPVTHGSTPASSIAAASAPSIRTARRRACPAVTRAVSHPRSGPRPAGSLPDRAYRPLRDRRRPGPLREGRGGAGRARTTR